MAYTGIYTVCDDMNLNVLWQFFFALSLVFRFQYTYYVTMPLFCGHPNNAGDLIFDCLLYVLLFSIMYCDHGIKRCKNILLLLFWFFFSLFFWFWVCYRWFYCFCKLHRALNSNGAIRVSYRSFP
jgi:hypothetical protein